MGFTGKLLIVCVVLLSISVGLGVISFFPVPNGESKSSIIINDRFNLTFQEIYRQGIGAFHGGENITILISQNSENLINFTLLTYGGPQYSEASRTDIAYVFVANQDYYEAVFCTNITEKTLPISLQVTVQKPDASFPFSGLSDFAKTLFIISLTIGTIYFVKSPRNLFDFNSEESKPTRYTAKNLKLLKYSILLSLIFWLLLLIINTYQLATFENWYTDSARHPYTSVLFTKVGFSVFDTPLKALSSSDNSIYKFVTWAEMPHLYPLGSIFLFLPFGVMLENGLSQSLVFKMEIASFIIIAHVCLYIFYKMYWNKELNLNPKEIFVKPLWGQELGLILKALGVYLFYIVLIVYAANGQFDSIPFLFSMLAISMFLAGRDDWFLFFVAVSSTFKYQAGIFLTPLIIGSLIRLFRSSDRTKIFKNKLLMASLGLFSLDIATAYLGASFLTGARPELVMNGVNAFSPHAQLPWGAQTLVVVLTLGVTLTCCLYLRNESRLISLSILFSLIPAFMMPYFQPWYLPFFFLYPLIQQSKRSIVITMIWLVFIVFVLSFGGLSYNPLAILDNIGRILNF